VGTTSGRIGTAIDQTDMASGYLHDATRGERSMARPVAARGEARQRVLDAALELFAQHGISGTSLQMIADHIGVTKAAIYYQFHTKDEIVLALIEEPLQELQQTLSLAAAQPSRRRRLDVLLRGFVDLVLENRQAAAVLQGDPKTAEIVASSESLEAVAEQFRLVAVGYDASPADKVALSVLASGVLMAGADPDLAGLDDETLRMELLAVGERILCLA
jgi:AcrR family transcriptional regulator